MNHTMTMASTRRVLVYSWLSYRALFSWSSPGTYLTAFIILPVSIGALFMIVNDVTHAESMLPVLGSALLAANNVVMYGIALVIMNERLQGTMELWLAAPQGLVPSLLAKSIVHLINGLLTAVLTFLSVSIMFGVSPPATMWRLIPCVLVVSVSAAGIGIVSASFGILGRDALAAPNALRSVILVGSGAVVDSAVLPARLSWFGQILPVRHAVEAGRQILLGAPLNFRLLGEELLVGLGWGTVGVVILHYMLVIARRRGRLHLQ